MGPIPRPDHTRIHNEICSNAQRLCGRMVWPWPELCMEEPCDIVAQMDAAALRGSEGPGGRHCRPCSTRSAGERSLSLSRIAVTIQSCMWGPHMNGWQWFGSPKLHDLATERCKNKNKNAVMHVELGLIATLMLCPRVASESCNSRLISWHVFFIPHIGLISMTQELCG